jgi:Transcriptional regulator, AbiEi antitoxin/Protein of unknown function (DUF559)
VLKERNRSVDREVGRTATAQHGVISIDQLERAGLSKRAVSARAATGRYYRIHRGVYAVGHEAIGDRGRLLAALLACGEGAVISHGTAAAFWGILERWPALIDVIVPIETGRKVDGIRARRCRFPNPDEDTSIDGVRCTTVARTLVDLAGIVRRISLTRAVEAAAVQGHLDLPALDLALDAGKGRRGVRALRAIAAEWRTADDRTSDVRSVFEARVLPALLRSGVPPPRCNEALCIDGRRLRPDFLWARERLIVETDGEATHGTPVAFRRDRRRDQVFLAAGYRVARVTWSDITTDLDATIRRIQLMLRSAVP